MGWEQHREKFLLRNEKLVLDATKEAAEAADGVLQKKGTKPDLLGHPTNVVFDESTQTFSRVAKVKEDRKYVVERVVIGQKGQPESIRLPIDKPNITNTLHLGVRQGTTVERLAAEIRSVATGLNRGNPASFDAYNLALVASLTQPPSPTRVGARLAIVAGVASTALKRFTPHMRRA